jgi:hypothetical protein
VIYIVAISPMLHGCAATNASTPDHFDGSRFHNRASGTDYSVWQEVKIAWELRTKKKNWPARFETQPYRAPADPVLHGIYGAPRVSLLPIGAYQPRWFMYRMHMNPDEAVRAHLDLHSQSSVGIHFGLIDNAGESYDAPAHDLIAARKAHGVSETDFIAPRYGQAFRY